MAERLNGGAVLHVRFDGRSLDLPLGDLHVGLGADDFEIKTSLAGTRGPRGEAARLYRGPARDRQPHRPARGRVRLIG